MKDKIFTNNYHINCGGKLVDLSTPKVMGIINCTPDSFYDGGKNNTLKTGLLQIEKHLKEGASFIDIGGASSKPNAEEVDEKEELKRIIPLIETAVNNFDGVVISVDTLRSSVAIAAIEAGATIINDISSGKADEHMLNYVIQNNIPYIAMHMKGTPTNMQVNPNYQDVVNEVYKELSELSFKLNSKGHSDLILDPGFGFGKTIEHNYTLLDNLDKFQMLGKPILAGVSRKSMIHKKLNINPEEALNGTTSLNTISLIKKANILRVHDVKEAIQLINLMDL